MDSFWQQNHFDQLAALLLANGIQPKSDESNYDFVVRIETWNRVKQFLSGNQIKIIMNNADLVRIRIDYLIVRRNGMLVIRQEAKWAFTLREMINKAGNWGRFAKLTSALSTTELVVSSIGQSLANSTMWAITAGITAIEIGIEFNNWYNGKITGKQFCINTGKKIIENGASVAGGACGAAIGITFGLCLGPIGGAVGGIVGAIIGSVSSAMATKMIAEVCENYYIKLTAKQILNEAIEFYELRTQYSLSELQTAKKYKIAHYHPDMWRAESQERQRKYAEKYSKTLINYEILSNALLVKNNPNVVL